MKLKAKWFSFVLMRAFFRLPDQLNVAQVLKPLERMPLTYWERAATLWKRMPAGYTHDEEFVFLGQGEGVWLLAKQAIANWTMFPTRFTKVLNATQPKEGHQVITMVRLLGLWWAMPARIVYTINESNRFGFAYGTLPGHAEQGEELFSVERDAEANVFYRLRAMSRPAFWPIRLFPRYARIQQARFRRASILAMRNAVNGKVNEVFLQPAEVCLSLQKVC